MIHGLTPRLAEGGKIKIGGLGEVRKGGSGAYRLPQKHEYFTITSTQRGPDIEGARGDLLIDQDLMLELTDLDDNGEVQPLTEIPIVVHSDDIDEVFPTSYAIYTGRKLACRGDGKVAEQYIFDGKLRTNKIKEVACPCERLGRDKDPCKPHGTLHCSIRVPGQAVAGSLYKWRTTSIISLQQVVGSLNHILATCGVLQGLPLMLCLRPMEVSPKGKTNTVYVCHVELRAKDVEAVQQQALQMAQMRQTLASKLSDARTTYRAMLEAPGEEEDGEEQAEVQQEFHPEKTEEPTEQEKARDAVLGESRTEQMKAKLGVGDG